jgi:hypothetical protein
MVLTLVAASLRWKTIAFGLDKRRSEEHAMSENRSAEATPLGAGSRRRLLQVMAYGGTVAATAIAGGQRGAAAQDATPQTAAGLPALTGTTYIGPTSDPNAFLAVIVAEATPGQPEQQARAYLCNAADIIAWFDEGGVTGEGAGQLDLRSADGAHLVGTVSGESANGTIALTDGASLTFDVPLATGADGLYTFTVTPDGMAQGTSSTGASLEGQLLLVGTISLPDGETMPYEWPVLFDDVADLRTIFREESGRRGEGHTRKGTRLVVQP